MTDWQTITVLWAVWAVLGFFIACGSNPYTPKSIAWKLSVLGIIPLLYLTDWIMIFCRWFFLPPEK